MGLFQDVANLVGGSYSTKHIINDGTEINVNLATGSVASLSAVRDLLPAVLNHNEPDIALTTGQSVSLYSKLAERVVVYLLSEGGVYWVHAFEYSTDGDYTTGLDLQNPDAAIRV